jgi:hypothetical protein
MVWTYMPQLGSRPAHVVQQFFVGSSNCSGVQPSLRRFAMDQCFKGGIGDWLKLTVQV